MKKNPTCTDIGTLVYQDIFLGSGTLKKVQNMGWKNRVIRALWLLKTFEQVEKQFYGVFRPYLKMSLPNVTALQANSDKIALFCQFYNVVAIFQFLHFSSGHHRTELTSPCKKNEYDFVDFLMKYISGSHQAVVRQSLGSRQAVVRQ